MLFFFFNDTATTEIYTLSLHDALPICWPRRRKRAPLSAFPPFGKMRTDRKSTRLNSSHSQISYAVFCLKKKKNLNSASRANECSEPDVDSADIITLSHHRHDHALRHTR